MLFEFVKFVSFEAIDWHALVFFGYLFRGNIKLPKYT